MIEPISKYSLRGIHRVFGSLSVSTVQGKRQGGGGSEGRPTDSESSRPADMPTGGEEGRREQGRETRA